MVEKECTESYRQVEKKIKAKRQKILFQEQNS